MAAANAKAPVMHPSAKEVKATRAKGEAWGFTLEMTPGGYAVEIIKIGSPLYVALRTCRKCLSFALQSERCQKKAHC